jgi:hypothetical protein
MTLKVFVLIRRIHCNQWQALAQNQTCIRQVTKGTERVENNRSSIWVLDTPNEAVEIGVDTRN